MSRQRVWRILAFSTIMLGSCSAPTAPTAGSPAQEQIEPSRPLVTVTRAEPPGLIPKQFRSTGFTAGMSERMLNAGLVINNDAGLPVPYLAEAVPQLNSDTWQVFPNGTMQTTYRLKANATWHDGQPLIADDFVLSYQVYAAPEFGLAASPPIGLIDRVTAPDPRSVVINWKKSYIQAGTLVASAFPPLPRHIVGQFFQTQDPDAFVANPFWTSQYVGAGPYRLDRWEMGAFLEAVAFDGHVLGKPKIPRIRELFISDQNTVVANMLSGTAHFTAGATIRFEEGQVLQQRWADSHAGNVIIFPNNVRNTNIQQRVEYATPRAFIDIRVRQALAHAIDREAQSEALFGGNGIMAYTLISPNASYYAQAEPALTKYLFDPRKTEQLMSEAGFTKSSDGVWASPTQGRMAFEAAVVASAQNTNENAILASAWRRLGFDVKEIGWSPAQSQERSVRNVFPGVWSGGDGSSPETLSGYRTDRVPTEANRWTGTNLGGWNGPPDYDRVVDLFETTLNPNERNQAAIQMARITTENCVFIPLYWNLLAQGFATGLTGPRVTDPEGSSVWNLHEWDFR